MGITLKSMPTIKRPGFTLIELLVTIAVLTILATAVLIAINPAKRQGQTRDKVRQHDLNLLYRAIETYKASETTYPNTGGSLWTYCNPPWAIQKTLTGANGYVPNLAPDYLKELPTDPKRKTNLGSIVNSKETGSTTDPLGTYCYYYISNSTGTEFKVGAICAAEDEPAPPGHTFYKGNNGWSCGDLNYAKFSAGGSTL